MSRYPKRTTLGLVLMAAQAFTYNAFLFSFGTILTKFFKVPDTHSASTCCRSRSATSSARSFSGACSTRSAAAS